MRVCNEIGDPKGYICIININIGKEGCHEVVYLGLSQGAVFPQDTHPFSCIRVDQDIEQLG
jgi:hypothetical protein